MRFVRLVAVAVLVAMASAAPAQDRAIPGPTLMPPIAGPAAAAPATMPVPAGAHALTASDVDTWLDGYLPYALHTGDIAGAVVTVVKDGKILTARGYGYADVAKRTPVDPEMTLFRPGSVSKLFTWTAVMQQVEQGKLELDRDVNAYIDFRIPPLGGKPITLRQLMTHTGGFEESAKGIVFYDKKYRLSLEQYLKRETPRRIFAPGTTPAYSNWGTALAGYIVQRVSGEVFEDYLDRHIFFPLGMRHTTFKQPQGQFAAQLATGYQKPGEPSLGFEFIGPGPAGEASSSGTDMARFMIANLQGGELDGQRILRPETATMMHDSPLDRVDPMSLVPPLNRMELGFFETNTNGREVIGHLGDTEAFHTSLHLFMKEGVGFYVSFNSPGRDGAVGTLRTALFHDFADRYFPDIAPADSRVDAKTAAQHTQLMVGNWWASRRAESSFLSIAYLLGQWQVAAGPHGELVIPKLLGPNNRPREWVEIAPFVWRDLNGHDRLAAKVIDGRVVRWAFDFVSPFEVFDRVPEAKSANWILPAVGASVVVLLLTLLYWPFAWWLRRRFRATATLTATSLRAARATRIMAGLEVAVLAAWGSALTVLLGSANALAGGFDLVLWILQILGAVVFVGSVLISGWNLAVSWTDGRHWARKLWSTLVFGSALVVLYCAWTFGLLAMSVAY